MFEVGLQPRQLADLSAVVPQANLDRLQDVLVPGLRDLLGDGQVINVNSTASGGGVAEMLHVLLPLTLGAGLNARWLVLDGEPDFFALTKRLHHRLHGSEGDDGSLGDTEAEIMRRVAQRNLPALLEVVKAGDVVVLHDPQTVPLAAMLVGHGVRVIWRCHVGIDDDNGYTAQAWDFLRRFLDGHVDQYVFTRAGYAPDWVPADGLRIIKPSIDPLAPKNEDLTQAQVIGALAGAGIIDAPGAGAATFERSDGTRAAFTIKAEVVREGPAPTVGTPLVVQVSRWDPLKDMAGVMEAFVRFVVPSTDAHLMLVGPSTAQVSDDPEGQRVLEDVVRRWRAFPEAERRRVHLVSLPMDDPEENGALVNAIQRHATVITQKSLAEGFGLTVTEAMFKARPVVASAVGGIADQIQDQASGVLLIDPLDLEAFGAILVGLLNDEPARERMGAAARQRVIDLFLPDTSLELWGAAVTAAITSRRPS